MKALVLHSTGIENLKYEDVDMPRFGPRDVLIRVRMTGITNLEWLIVNDLPYSIFTIKKPVPLNPMPHILGLEVAGTVEAVGERVRDLSVGDRVAVYEIIFDGSCDLCLQGNQQICRNQKHFGINTNGGWAEYTVVPESNAIRIPGDMSWELAASLSHSVNVAYHALNRGGVDSGKTVVVFGASGNTGMFAVQLAKLLGATVIAVTRNKEKRAWLRDLGADHVASLEDVAEVVNEATHGRMADVVINSLGNYTWKLGLEVTGSGGRVVFFGGYESLELTLNPLQSVYNREISVIGTRVGSLKEFKDLLGIYRNLKVRTWRVYKLNEWERALTETREKDGKQFIEVS